MIVTAFRYAAVVHGLPSQRMRTVGGVGSGTRVKVAAAELTFAPFVAVTASGASGALGVPVKLYVRLAPVPTTVKPLIAGNE